MSQLLLPFSIKSVPDPELTDRFCKLDRKTRFSLRSNLVGFFGHFQTLCHTVFITKKIYYSGHSPSNLANEVVRYLEREAAEGSEGQENNARSTTTTPMDPRMARSLSQARSETDAYSSVKLTPASPLLPLEQLLMQQDHDVLLPGTFFATRIIFLLKNLFFPHLYFSGSKLYLCDKHGIL